MRRRRKRTSNRSRSNKEEIYIEIARYENSIRTNLRKIGIENTHFNYTSFTVSYKINYQHKRPEDCELINHLNKEILGNPLIGSGQFSVKELDEDTGEVCLVLSKDPDINPKTRMQDKKRKGLIRLFDRLISDYIESKERTS